MADGSMPAGARTLRVLALGVNWFDSGSGGLDRVFRDLALGLPDAGVSLRGLVLGPPDVAALTGGRVRAFGQGGGLPARLLAARQAVAAALRDQPSDVVAAHFALFAAPALDVLGRQPLVMHFHGPWADEAAEEGAGRFGCALRRRLERTVYHRAARVITLSHAFAGLVQARYGVPANRISVIPGSVDLARFAPAMPKDAARAALGWPTGRPLLLAVRRLVRRMGLDRLIEAMPQVRAAVPGAQLMIAGQGAEEAALKTLAQSRGVADQVCFLGFLPEARLPLAYRAADINVVPSRALEGFGLTAAEALAAGTPSVVAPIGGLPEVVAPLSPNLVFRSATPADMAAGLIAALQGGAPGEAACVQFARERFSTSRVIADTARLYREAAG
jgi:glycosyltransferase involved in cell wall biosynthesis